MTEQQIQKDIIGALKANGALVFRMNAGSRNYNNKQAPSGTPDILAVLPKMTLWVEVKTESGKLRLSQEFMIKELHERGQNVIVARCVEDVLEAIK